MVALKAVQALGAGHPEAAQALASEQYISDNLGAYAEATRVVNGFITEDDRWYVVYCNAYLPLFIVPSLYEPWRPTDGTPAPDPVSRDVTVHQLTAGHLNLVNALIAVLQVSGLVAGARWVHDFVKSHQHPATT